MIWPQPLAQQSQLRDFFARDVEFALGIKIHLAGVFAMQFVQLRADLAPDARLLGVVVDERRAKTFQAVLAAQREQLLAPAMYP